MIVPPPVVGSAMAGGIVADAPRPLPDFLLRDTSGDAGIVLDCSGVAKRFGGRSEDGSSAGPAG